jgi:hypothetical protein
MLWSPGAHFSALADEPAEDKDARQASAEVCMHVFFHKNMCIKEMMYMM